MNKKAAVSLEFLQIFAAMMLLAAMLFGFYTATAGQLMSYSSQMFGSAAISKLVKDANFVCTYPGSERLVDLQMRNANITIRSDPEHRLLMVATQPGGREEEHTTYCPVYCGGPQTAGGKATATPLNINVRGNKKLRVVTERGAYGEGVCIT